jgi:hypothetical protein
MNTLLTNLEHNLLFVSLSVCILNVAVTKRSDVLISFSKGVTKTAIYSHN